VGVNPRCVAAGDDFGQVVLTCLANPQLQMVY